jgi:NAD(P)-dependent dehydrogenase (short-subunit alcohol dehydrogenase family)
MNINFKNQNVLITGATRGIGRQIAEDMLSAGANVIVTGTSKKSLDGLTGDFLKIPVNFLNKKSSQDFIDFISNKRIDVCINNAGINKIGEIENIDERDWDSIIKVNLSTPFKIIKEVSKGMKNNKYGRIVNISSIWGVISKEYRGPYSSSKFGLVGLTLATAAELAKFQDKILL